MTDRTLDKREILDSIGAHLDGWNYNEEGFIETTMEFRTFQQALEFMVECAQVIIQEDHHPEWTNVCERVHVKYRTHSADNKVTQKDIKMARELERIYRQPRYFPLD